MRTDNRQLGAVASPAAEESREVPDQVIDATMARSLHADACRDYPLVAWIIMRDPPDRPGKFAARLATKSPLPYVLIGETLAEVQEQLPPGLVRSERQSADLPKVVEVWFAE